ncbi:YceI family protein [Flammeovirgaceae bacterium SG7u.111]|nr:YceI family protein [Flammeovirgaceae bacterium SG7u.132]WPO36647.1 YceI family protein [Flammeovirgaceae bacterium SG7u.111]
MNLRISLLTSLILLLINNVLTAQNFKVSDKSKVTIEGTSTMHDWESVVQNVSGSGVFTIENGQLKNISSLNVTFVVKSIESGKSKMNSLTYDALKEKTNPNITLKITKIKSISASSIDAEGTLTIAGKSQTVNVKGKPTVSGNTVTITGEKEIDMTAYGMEPPTAMLGTIKVGKVVTIKYNLILNQ